MIGSATNSSFCNLYGDINEGNFEELLYLEQSIDPKVLDYLSVCFN